MVAVLGFGEHTLVEGEPGELAIDEACGGVEVDRLCLDRICAGSHFRSPVECRPRILSCVSAPVLLPCATAVRWRAGRSLSRIAYGQAAAAELSAAAW